MAKCDTIDVGAFHACRERARIEVTAHVADPRPGVKVEMHLPRRKLKLFFQGVPPLKITECDLKAQCSSSSV